MSTLSQAARELRWDSRAFLAIGVIGLFANLLQLTGPLFMMQVYDRVLVSRSIPTLLGLSFFALLAFALSAILETARSRAVHKVAALFDERVSPACYLLHGKMDRLPTRARFDPIADLDKVRNFAGGPGVLALMDLPWIPLNLLILYILHPALAAVTLFGAVLLGAVSAIGGAATKNTVDEMAERFTSRMRATEDLRRTADAVRGMGMGPNLGRRWASLNGEYLSSLSLISQSMSAFGSVNKIGRIALQSVILGVGAVLVIENQMSAGAIIASSVISSRALLPIDQALANWRGFLGALAGLKRIREGLAAAEDRPIRMVLPLPTQSLAAWSLASGPWGQRQPVISRVSFELAAGDAMAIVGPSGSGKSSVGRALCGVWDNLSGSVRYDGLDLGNWDEVQRSKFVGYLPQDLQLLPGTVAENISRFSEDVRPELVIEAAKAAAVHDLISSFPLGYDTLIGTDQGMGLSGGQLQRIGLARALYGRPFVLILDEPNSGLDTDGERALIRTVGDLRDRGAIVVLITHKVNVAECANKILVMRNGVATKFGRIEEFTQQPTIEQSPPQTQTLSAQSNDDGTDARSEA